MVINCVPRPEMRGDMLVRLRMHLRPRGLLFLNLPLQCLTLSPFITEKRFRALLEALGFAVVEKSASRRVAKFCLRRVRLHSSGEPPRETRNNTGSGSSSDTREEPGCCADAGQDVATRRAGRRLFAHPPRELRRGRSLTNSFSLSFVGSPS